MDAKICHMLGFDPYWWFYKDKINGDIDDDDDNNRQLREYRVICLWTMEKQSFTKLCFVCNKVFWNPLCPSSNQIRLTPLPTFSHIQVKKSFIFGQKLFSYFISLIENIYETYLIELYLIEILFDWNGIWLKWYLIEIIFYWNYMWLKLYWIEIIFDWNYIWLKLYLIEIIFDWNDPSKSFTFRQLVVTDKNNEWKPQNFVRRENIVYPLQSIVDC